MTASKYKWFEVVEITEQSLDDSLKDQVPSYLDILIREPSSLSLSEGERQLLLQSKEAFDAAAKDLISEEREARAANGEIVSDSDSEQG